MFMTRIPLCDVNAYFNETAPIIHISNKVFKPLFLTNKIVYEIVENKRFLCDGLTQRPKRSKITES